MSSPASGINDSLFRSLTEMWLNIYCNQYKLMGSPAVMTAKVIWDIAFYWGFLGLMYSNGRFVSVADDPGVVPHLEGPYRAQQPHAAVLPGVGRGREHQPSSQFVDLYSRAQLHGDAAHRDDGGGLGLRSTI